MARPSAASSRMEPRERPEKTLPSVSPQARLRSISLIAAMAALRTAVSLSPAVSVSGSNRLRTAGVLTEASASTAASRTAGSASCRLALACAVTSSSRIAGSVSSALAFASTGASSAPTLLCSSRAADRRTLRSVSNSLSAAKALANSPRKRLLTVIVSAPSGRSTVSPLSASSVLSPSKTKSRSSST